MISFSWGDIGTLLEMKKQKGDIMTNIEICERIIKQGHCDGIPCVCCPLFCGFCRDYSDTKECAQKWLDDHTEDGWEVVKYYDLLEKSKVYAATEWPYLVQRTLSVKVTETPGDKHSYEYNVIVQRKKIKASVKKSVTFEVTDEELKKIEKLLKG
jgi:hypothetical protein